MHNTSFLHDSENRGFSLSLSGSVCLMVFLILMLSILKNYNRKTNKPVAEPAAEAEMIFSMIDAFGAAKILYSEESKRNRPSSTISTLGIKFGYFSRLRYRKGSKLSKIEEEIEGKLRPAIEENKQLDYKKIKNELIKTLICRGSLWDGKSTNHLFTNYFLLCLRRVNINGYRKLVGEAYGISFISEEIKLNRRDQRATDIIYREGFQLQEADNLPSTRKSCYASLITGSHGISLSKVSPPEQYGHFFYEVNLPKDHDLLLIDILASPRNQGLATEDRLLLQEVNSLDDIPYQYVRCCWIANNKVWTFNTGFSSNNIGPISRPARGCY